eukprot:CCRYP_009990-RA/>CCRYP_009990-RA protein AED:0.20 eAED:0.41 QI:0/0/0/1/0/0/3/0/99
MSPLLELVVLACSNDSIHIDRENANKLISIADVGCDHGDKENDVVDGSFLYKVIGTDISTNALTGALVSDFCIRSLCHGLGRNGRAYYDRDIDSKEQFE